MPPTLASLVQHSALRLAVLAGQDRLDTPVRWAHASELADPTPYLDGGELVMITAVKMDAEDPDAMREYVRLLAGRGVVGLAFAAGVNYERAPEALVAAARETRLPLLEVPRRTPFIAIGKVVSAAIAAEQYQTVTEGFDAQRDMTTAALSQEGPTALLTRLAGHVKGWVALYDVSGSVVALAPAWAARRAARFTGDAERLRDRPSPASAVVSESEAGEDRVELQSIGTGRRAKAVLAVGTAEPLGTAERYAVHSAVALLTLTTERSRALQEGEQRLGAAVLRMLLAGESEHARAVAGRLYGGLLDAPLRVIVAEPATAARNRTSGVTPPAMTLSAPGAAPGVAITPSGTPVVETDPSSSDREPSAVERALDDLADVLETAAARNGESVLVVPDGERLIVLASDGGAAASACARHAADAAAEETSANGDRTATGGRTSAGPRRGSTRQPKLIIGVSAPVGIPAAAIGFKQADQALSVARRRGATLVEHEDVAAGSVLPLLQDEAVRAFADGLLRKLYEHDAHGRGDLVASLRAWLSRHGQWDAAAADLGVHRHTLRYRMRRVEEILGRSLDDPDVRMELWLALKVTS